jgi:hypothetical protein
VDQNNDGHDSIIVSIATEKHSIDGHDDIIVPVAARKHSSERSMMSSCPTCFFYFNELVKSLKNYILFLNITNVVIFLFQLNGFKNIYYPLN